jgi:hypothetical protein
MSVIIHFRNGNDMPMEVHYREKEYRDDVIVEIDKKFYEVYFFVADTLEYEMTRDGFFSLPGLIILDEISSEKIYKAVNYLVDIHYFDSFNAHRELPLNNTFASKWYINTLSGFELADVSSYVLRS